MSNKVLFSINSGAGLYPIGFGKACCIIEQMKYKNEDLIFAGVSSGAFVALALACGFDTESKLKQLNDHFTSHFDSWWKNNFTWWYDAVESTIDYMLPDKDEEIDKKLTGRLFVSISYIDSFLKFPSWEVVSTFKNRQDVVDAILSSSHHPIFAQMALWKNCNNRKQVDGAFAGPNILTEKDVGVEVRKSHLIHYDDINLPWTDWLCDSCPHKFDRLFKLGKVKQN